MPTATPYPMQAPRAFGYCRKSTNEQREESLEAQQRAIVTFAATAGYELVQVYKDHGNSGRRGERPEFQRMLADAAAAGVQYIIVHKLDRFFRNADQQTVVEMQLRRQGVQVVSAAEHFDATPQGQFMRNVTKAINQWYSANLAQEVAKGLRENALTARTTGGPPPLGYAVDKATGQYVIVPREAEAVRLIFDLYQQGAGYAEIIDALNAGGYVTRRGQPFGKNSLYDILRNEKYTGLYIWNRLAPADVDGRTSRRRLKPRDEWVCVENGMPQIIPTEQWQAVQDEMDKRKHRNAQYKAKSFYLLSGLVYCGGCGGTMAGERHRYSSHGRAVEYRYYRCAAQHRQHDGGVHAHRVNADRLENAVVDYIQHIVLDPVNMDALCVAVLEALQPDGRNAERAKELKREAGVIQQRVDRLYQAIENGLDADGAIERINTLQKQRMALLAQASDLDVSAEAAAASVDKLRKAWAGINLRELQPEKMRAIVRDLVYKIIVFDDGPHGSRLRIILNPARLNPETIPKAIETAPFSELQDFSHTGGSGLPLPKADTSHDTCCIKLVSAFCFTYHKQKMPFAGIKKMEFKNLLPAQNRDELRQWLSENYNKEEECRVVVKRGRPVDNGTFWYIDAVEEAMCFGWIDSTTKKMDNGITTQRLAPRRKNSLWSELNKERCRRMERLGRMTDAGRAVLPDMSENGFVVDKVILDALQADAEIWENFQKFPSLYQRVRIDTIQIKKKQPELFQSRLQKLLDNTKKGIMYGEWNDNGRLLTD